MRFRTTFLIVILVLVGLFAALNWNAFLAPTTLSLLFADVQAPLGVVMLAIVIVISAVFLLYIVALQTTALLESRRISKQLETQRDLADQAEKSRFVELRSYLQAELQLIGHHHTEHRTLLSARLDQLQSDLQRRIELSDNTHAAQIGELDDRLQRSGIGATNPAAHPIVNPIRPL